MPIKLYFWALKCEFYVIFTCYKMLFFLLLLFFSPTLSQYKTILMRKSSQKDLALGPEFANPYPVHTWRLCPPCLIRVGWGRGTPDLTRWETGPGHLDVVPWGSLSKGHPAVPGCVASPSWSF